ncbi:P-loop containing nucleoside triphosphate hydrolase protein [Penicillium robsamsonii]|uniref:P-loop containing nucleoside triphosphate hydrolase protein n=1 Tax=Penicillium robsamsonii TaxID=1792511 RepID=UPI0025487A8B|nr:P-loop containing nucleoside triphosphate hydrolase protein [Penicillium robsamsonii]KAJ5824716.1 P-loop containing nucleoside triphosphate hydrolase protein [Penicillium robsamsonii]
MTSTSVVFSGSINSGTQVGVNYGSIHLSQGPEGEGGPETPPPPVSTVPFVRDPDFVDRGTLLGQVYDKGTTPGARIALVGLGGVGKSQLAIECSYRMREESPNTWAFWIHAGNAARYEQSCRDIADRVKIPGRRDPTSNIFKLFHDWLVDERNGKWVLVLDNVDDSSFLHEVQSGHSGAQGRPLFTYLPISLNGSMIITSRSRGAALSMVEDGDIITIEPMDPSHATMLFKKKLGAQIEEENIIQLAAALDYIPLAIVQAANYIKQRRPRVSVPQYLTKFQKSDLKRTSLLAYDMGQLRRDREANNSILTTWQISFNHIQQIEPAAADLLSLMSFFDRQGIPGTLLQYQPAKENGDIHSEDKNEISDDDEGIETDSSVDDDFEDNILTLRNYSMISIGVNEDTFEMHRLVQLAMRKWLEAHGKLEHWKQQFIEILHHTFPTGHFETWAVCQPLFPHVQSAVTQRPVQEDILQKWASLVHRSACFAFTKEDIVECEKMAVLAMKTRKRLFGPYDEKTLESSEIAGLAYSLSGRWKDAEILQLQVMNARNQLLGPENPDTLVSISNLASTYRDQGRWKEAEELDVQVLETRSQVLGPEHPDTLVSISNLASTYRDQGRWKEAEELDVQVLETRSQVLGPEHPDTLVSISNLALTYMNQGRWKEAEELHVQVLETRSQVLGPEHPDTLVSIGNLASTYRDQGRWKEAEELQVQVAETHSQVLGPEHPHTLVSMNNLASTYRSQGRWKEAEELHVQVLETRSQVLGPEHPHTLVSMNNLASTYRSQGRWKEAEELQVQVLETRKQVLGPEHPHTLVSMNNLASTYRSQGRWKEAEELHVQVLETRSQVLGPEHPDTLASINNLASTYWNQGRWKEAEELQIQVAETRSQVLGPKHPDTLVSMHNLASTYMNQGRWKEAEELEVQVMNTYKQVLGPAHPNTLASMNSLAHTLRSLGQLDTALQVMIECAQLCGQN